MLIGVIAIAMLLAERKYLLLRTTSNIKKEMINYDKFD